MKRVNLAIIEPFYSGSHKYWVDSLKSMLSANVVSFTLPGRHWKWRLSAGAIPLAKEVNASNLDIDLFLVTDMLDVSLFKALLTPKYASIPLVLYMHENQVSYPFQMENNLTEQDRHYGLINYKSVITADRIWFNSSFHLQDFFTSMHRFLQPMPEGKFHQKIVAEQKNIATVVPLGIDVTSMEQCRRQKVDKHTILWNHRWEHDKNPESFFNALFQLSNAGYDFDLIVCGENYGKHPAIFDQAKGILEDHIVHWGTFESKSEYYEALWQATILPVTNIQEFFGLSVMEAIYCGVSPLLPNRLSYPSLYPNKQVFYDSDESLIQKLKALLDSSINDLPRLNVSSYDWDKVIKKYDAEIATIVA